MRKSPLYYLFGLFCFGKVGFSGVIYTTGDVFVSVSNGLVKEFKPNGTLVQTLNTGNGNDETTGSAFDASGNLYVATFSGNTVAKFDSTGNLVTRSFATGFNSDPESISFTRLGNLFVGEADGLRQINEFDANGTNVASFSPNTVPGRGTDWIDCACDQHTIYYTSEGNTIRRFDTQSNMQLPDFNTSPLPGQAAGLPPRAYALRILSNGGVLVADTDRVVELDNTGTVIKQYTTADTFEGQNIGALFALSLDPDGMTFWTGDLTQGIVYHVNIANGTLLGSFNAQTNGFELGGISIFGEQTQGLCAAPEPSNLFLLGAVAGLAGCWRVKTKMMDKAQQRLRKKLTGARPQLVMGERVSRLR